MILPRRRRSTWLVVLAVALLGGVFLAQYFRGRVEEYRSGEVTEGIVDTLARDVPQDHPAVVFTDVAREAGLVFEHFPGTRTNQLPEDMGSGVALGDVDGDGWTDVFLANIAGPMTPGGGAGGAGRSRLFRNLGDGRFEDVSDQSGIELEALANAAAFLDADSDGDLDLFVTTYGTCRLYRNEGALRFVDASVEAGLEAWPGFWSAVSVADYDLDGALDLYLCGYVVYDESRPAAGAEASQYGKTIPALINPSTFEPHPNLLLRGLGDGTFRDVTAEAGVADVRGRGLGALFCDLDGNGLPDLYVANDVSDNALYLGVGEGRFVDVTAPALVGDYRGAMGLAAADYDGDLDLDLFVTHWVAQENALYTQHPGQVEEADGAERSAPEHPLFFDDAARLGLGHTALDRVGWATRFFDYDNDGWLDLFVVNGSTIPLADTPELMEPMRSQLFWHERGERGFFHEVGAVSGEFFREKHVGRGGATFDYDLDGDEDLVVVAHGERAFLLRNDGGNARPALRVRVRQPDGNRFAIGARVYLTAGERTAMELVGSQGSYLSQHAVGEVAFGLGDATSVERLEVVWPDGTRESAGPFLPGSLVTWVRGAPPRVEPLVGRREVDARGPSEVEGQRRFYEVRGHAQDARLAGEPERAIELYLDALALWPGHGDCLYYLANSLVEVGDERLALNVFERMVAFEEQSNQGWMQIGLLRLPGGDAELDDLDRARAAFERCHSLNGEESRPVVMLGITAMLQGRDAEAARLFADAGHLNPRSVEARWFGGRLAWKRGDRAAAAALLSEAHALARAQGAGESVSNEGDTATGRAMTAAGGPVLEEHLERWRSLASRPDDPEAEYGAR